MLEALGVGGYAIQEGLAQPLFTVMEWKQQLAGESPCRPGRGDLSPEAGRGGSCIIHKGSIELHCIYMGLKGVTISQLWGLCIYTIPLHGTSVIASQCLKVDCELEFGACCSEGKCLC